MLAIIASLGGGTVLVYAFSNFLGRIWPARILEQDRSRSQREAMKLRIVGLVILILVSLSARSEEIAWVWLRMPPRPAEEIQVIAEAQARADIANDTMKVKGFGLVLPEEGDQYDRLLQKYGLTDENLGCVVDEERLKLVEIYNDRIESELERRYGSGFWQRFGIELEAANQVARKQRDIAQINKDGSE